MEAEVKKLRDCFGKLEPDVSEKRRNTQARLEDLNGNKTAELLSKVTDELSEKRGEASPEIEGGVGGRNREAA